MQVYNPLIQIGFLASPTTRNEAKGRTLQMTEVPRGYVMRQHVGGYSPEAAKEPHHDLCQLQSHRPSYQKERRSNASTGRRSFARAAEFDGTASSVSLL